jgi:hypothetical protein
VILIPLIRWIVKKLKARGAQASPPNAGAGRFSPSEARGGDGADSDPGRRDRDAHLEGAG